MKDLRLYIDKLQSDAEQCIAISQTAASEAKRSAFTNMADTYRRLAQDLQRILDDQARLDAQRDGQLLGLLSGKSDTAPTSEHS